MTFCFTDMVVLPIVLLLKHRSLGIKRNIIHLDTIKDFFRRRVQTEQLNFSVFLCLSSCTVLNPVIIAVSTSCPLALQARQEGRCVPGFVSMHPYTRVLMDVYAHGHTCVSVGWIYQQSWELRASQFCPAPNQRCLLPSSCLTHHMKPMGRKGHVGIALQELLHLSLIQFFFSASPKANKPKDFWKISLLLLLLFLFLVLVLNKIT